MYYNNEVIKIVKSMYLDGMSLSKISNSTGIGCPNTIRKILLSNGVDTRNHASKKAIIKNESFFESIDNEEKAYFLGFIMADGNVYHRPLEKSESCFRMELSNTDSYILEKLRLCLGLDSKVKQTRKNCCKLALHSNKIVNDLSKYGVIPHKTKKENFVLLERQLMPHFIRGFFDGDGWVTNTTSHGKRKGSRKSIGFTSNYEFLNKLMNYLNRELNLPLLKIAEREGCSMYTYSAKQDVSKLIEYMYANATVFLTRKKEKCDYVYTNTEVIKN